MIHGLYSAANGMLVQQMATDTTANNLANASTAGYRRQLPSITSFAQRLDASLQAKLPVNPVYAEPTANLLTLSGVTDPRTGSIRQTGNPTDFALRGDGFFVLDDAAGHELLTRSGSFTLNPDNQLTTEDGLLVQGERGPISIDGATWEVDPAGRVLVDSDEIDRLRVVVPSDPASMTRVGATRWQAAGVMPMSNPRVQQGYLESSNVNPVAEMVALITASRQFEANQKSVQAIDSTLDRLVNEVGRTA